MLSETPDGLYCPAGDVFIDPWNPVKRALITHAHGDHARPGSAAYLCTEGTAALLRRRFGADAGVETTAYGTPLTIGDVRVSFHPAGHVLGSAQIRLEGAGGTWVVSGDYKRAADPTCAPFEPVRCDTFVTESTFGLPIYRWDSTASVVSDVFGWWQANAAEQRTSVLFCYTIGKAQRLLAELAALTDRRVFVHGMMLPMIEAYREAGVAMLPVESATEQPRGTSFAGELVLAPLPARGTPWMRRLGTHSDAFASGLDAGARRAPPARLRSRVRDLRPRRLAGAAADHRRDRRYPSARHARPRRAAGALRARAGTGCWSDPDGVGGGTDGGD